MTNVELMRQYVNAIRNTAKRDYAKRYAIWLMRDDKQTNLPPEPFHLSAMAAQAVRMRLNELAGKR